LGRQSPDIPSAEPRWERLRTDAEGGPAPEAAAGEVAAVRHAGDELILLRLRCGVHVVRRPGCRDTLHCVEGRLHQCRRHHRLGPLLRCPPFRFCERRRIELSSSGLIQVQTEV